MKTLFLMRHAKSSWKDLDLADIDRPLNDRGSKAAVFMGRFISQRGHKIDRVLTSPATRARTTAEIFAEAARLKVEIVHDERVYEAATGTLLEVASEAPDDIDSLMLVGHNPGMEGAIRVLTGEFERMPTAAIAVIELGIDDWKKIAPGVGRLSAVFRPRDEMGEI